MMRLLSLRYQITTHTLGKKWDRTILNSALIESSNFRALVSLARIN